VKHFKLSWDPRFLKKLTDVVRLYSNPPQQAMVICVDEKSQIQALDLHPAGPVLDERALWMDSDRMTPKSATHAKFPLGEVPMKRGHGLFLILIAGAAVTNLMIDPSCKTGDSRGERGLLTSTVIVAPFDAPAKLKARADFVCNGHDDQIELLKSITQARKYPTRVDMNSLNQRSVECYGRHSVVWLPGTYSLSATLTIPEGADMVINAEGAYIHYTPASGDAVVVTGMNRCRYHFGTIDSASAGAALCIKPTPLMSALMSEVTFTGLVGHDQKGTGLYIDPSRENVCTNRVEGTDIRDFDVGVYLGEGRIFDPKVPGSGKADTNWFWFSYIRMCNTSVWEKGRGVDSSVWNVNVEATTQGSVAVRIGGKYGKWYIINGVVKGGKALILDPGAAENAIEMHPPLELWTRFLGKETFEDHSGNNTNMILSSPALASRR
jgi:hypothetical protein